MSYSPYSGMGAKFAAEGLQVEPPSVVHIVHIRTCLFQLLHGGGVVL